MEWKIPLFRMYNDESDVNAVSDIIKRGTFWAAGPEITEFEKKLAEFSGTKFALTFNSGTSALHVALLAHGVRTHEVIVPSFTFISTANAVILAGGTPVFAEVEPATIGLNSRDVLDRITPNTKAIIPMHYGGFPCADIEVICTLAKDHDLVVIEDVAESMGAHLGGTKAGAFGDSAIYSFCQNKIITTGEGGALVTDSEEIYEKAKLIRSHGRLEGQVDYFSSTQDNDYLEVGYNFRMPTILAALGIAQLEKIEKLIHLRRAIAREYNHVFSQIDDIQLLREVPDAALAVYQLYTIFLPNERVRDELQHALKQAGVMTKVYFQPAHLKTLYKENYDYREGDLPVTESLSQRALTLPLFPEMTEEDIQLVTSTVEAFFKH